jgi:hypothetical protein
MRADITNLTPSLVARLIPVLEAAEVAGCASVFVFLETGVGFHATIECPDQGEWTMDAHEFSYLLGHMKQHIETLTP